MNKVRGIRLVGVIGLVLALDAHGQVGPYVYNGGVPVTPPTYATTQTAGMATNAVNLGNNPPFSYSNPYQQVGWMSWMNDETLLSFTNAALRVGYIAGPNGAENVRPVFGNFYLNPAGNGIPFANSVVWNVQASVEYPSNTFYVCTQGGNSNMLMQVGQLLIPDETFNFIPPGSNYWVRAYVWVNTGTPQNFPGGYITEQTSAKYPQQYEWYKPNCANDITFGGATNANYGYAFSPVALIGSAQSAVPAIGILGTSIYPAPDAAHAGVNYHEGMWLDGLLGTLPFIMGAQGGSTIENYENNGNEALTLTKFCRNIVLPDAVNDINNGESYSQITNAYYSVVAEYSGRGNRLWLPTPTPISTSNNGWTNDAGQTPVDFQVTTQLVAWIRTGPLGCNVLDVRSCCESPAVAGVWAGLGTNQISLDGLHPYGVEITTNLVRAVTNYIPEFEQP
jgi:hypothetical protein